MCTSSDPGGRVGEGPAGHSRGTAKTGSGQGSASCLDRVPWSPQGLGHARRHVARGTCGRGLTDGPVQGITLSSWGRDFSACSQRPGSLGWDQLQRRGRTHRPAELPRALRGSGSAPSVSAAACHPASPRPWWGAFGGLLLGSAVLSWQTSHFSDKNEQNTEEETH